MERVREERLARNEAVFRSVNERIHEIARGHGPDEHLYEFICECADPECTERVELTRTQYEAIRADGRQFVLSTGHDLPAIERIVDENAGHVVIEKVGLAGEVAEALDPRGA